MKIVLTVTEARTILEEYFRGKGVVANVEVLSEIHPHEAAYLKVMSQLDPHKNPENKIPAIRMLREEVRHLESNDHLPLADAKYAIESTPQRVIDYIKKHNTLFGFPNE